MTDRRRLVALGVGLLIASACSSGDEVGTTSTGTASELTLPTLPPAAIAPLSLTVAVETPFCTGLASDGAVRSLPSAFAFLGDPEVGDEAVDVLRRAADTLDGLLDESPPDPARLTAAAAALRSVADDEGAEFDGEVLEAIEVFGEQIQEACGFSITEP